MAEPTLIRGLAYEHPATLEVAGETLTWRARRSPAEAPENIVTTIHEVRDAHWIDRRYSWPGGVLVGCGVVWTATYGPASGGFAVAAGLALFVWRQTHPRRFLVLDIGDRRLLLDVAGASAKAARALVARIEEAIDSGELPSKPPTLP